MISDIWPKSPVWLGPGIESLSDCIITSYMRDVLIIYGTIDTVLHIELKTDNIEARKKIFYLWEQML